MTEEEMNELNRQLRALTAQMNESAHPDFDGLSPAKMHRLQQRPLEVGSVVRWQKDIPAEKLSGAPMLALVAFLMERLAEKETKLTATGNLPSKIVREMYDLRLLPEEFVDTGLTKIKGENDWFIASIVKHLANQLGWTKKRKGKLSLTAKGRKVLAGNRQAMLETLFRHHFQRFNLGFSDGYAQDGLTQKFTGFLLYQLLLHGREWRPLQFYNDAMLKAFPMLPDAYGDGYFAPEDEFCRAFYLRYFDRLLYQYGLVRLKGKRHYRKTDDREVMATDLFRALFRLDMDAQRPERPEDVDIQIKSALFDAEMGGMSWTSNDIPPELQDLFHEQVRAFYGEGEAGAVTVGSVVGDLSFPDPETVNTEEKALSALEKVLTALMERGVVFQPPYHVTPVVLYRFVIEDLFAHKIPPPDPMLQIFIPFEEVETELSTESETVAELFLLALFSLDVPLPEELFDEPMRLGNEMVSRAEGLAHAQAWRDGLTAVRPISFAPGPRHDDKGFVYQFVELCYEVDRVDGSSERFDTEGVVQLGPREDGLKVVGGNFQGFEF